MQHHTMVPFMYYTNYLYNWLADHTKGYNVPRVIVFQITV